MSDSVRSIDTDAGPIAVRALRDDTLERMRELFPAVDWVESKGRRFLGLQSVHGSRVMQGLRTGYGWYPPEQREAVEREMGVVRLRIIEASRAFLSRGFKGVLMPAASIIGQKDTHSQLGELLFLRARGPLEQGVSIDRTLKTYEETFGPGATSVLLTFVRDMAAAWGAANQKVTLTDLEPCPADWHGVFWRSDIVIVDDRVVVLRLDLVPEDPLLPVLAGSGITEVEYAPSAFLIRVPDPHH